MTSNILILLMTGCFGTYDEGVDTTTLTGELTIAEGERWVEDKETRIDERDTVDKATVLGEVSWRWEKIPGEIVRWPDPEEAGSKGDIDWYAFSNPQGGAFSLVFEYKLTPPAAPDTGDTGDTGGDTAANDTADTGDTAEPIPLDDLLFKVGVYDLEQEYEKEKDMVPLYESDTNLAEGRLVFEDLELEAGKAYGVRIEGLQDLGDEGGHYALHISGADPNDAGVLVGAYTDASDYMNRGALMGGSDAREWTFDAETLSYTSSYSMLWFKGVTSDEVEEEVEGEGEEGEEGETIIIETHEVEEGAGTVYLVAGDFTTLNQALPAGTLHNSVPVAVTLSADTENTAEMVTLDAIAPKVYGWQETEVEPNDCVWTDEGLGELENAQAMPIADGVGFINTIAGVHSFSAEAAAAEADWETHEMDIFAITVPESLNAAITLSWANAEVNLDSNLYDASGVLVAAGWDVADVNPEFYETSMYGVTFEPGETYYLAIMGWDGPEGEHPYTIEIEWMGI